jgi:hypothetical protein
LTALIVALICQIEGGFSETDCAAIYWIGVKRGVVRDESPTQILERYSVPYRNESPRALRVLTWSQGHVPGGSRRLDRHWRAQRAYAERLVRGEIPDPCPDATDWNDRTSFPRGRMVQVCVGLTSNKLYSDPVLLRIYRRKVWNQSNRLRAK